MTPTELIVAWLESSAAIRDEASEGETYSDLRALQEFLESHIRKDGDLRGLRDDLVRYGTQHAPREIGDLKGFLDWSLAQVEWQRVNHFIADRNDDAPTGAPTNHQAASWLPIALVSALVAMHAGMAWCC